LLHRHRSLLLICIYICVRKRKKDAIMTTARASVGRSLSLSLRVCKCVCVYMCVSKCGASDRVFFLFQKLLFSLTFSSLLLQRNTQTRMNLMINEERR